MAKITFENFSGQIANSDFIALPLLAEGSTSELTQGYVDPNRFPGVLAPFPFATALTNAASVTTAVTKMVNFIGSTPLVFGIGGDQVYEITATTITNTGNFPHTVDHSHTGETLSDIVIYENNGTHEVFYSFNDDTDGDIGRLSAIPGTDTFDDDYFSAVVGGAVLDKNYPHPMAVADNNILYIGNGSVLASMDLRTGSPVATDTEIDLLGGWVIKDHMSHKGFHWIAARETHEGDDPTSSQPGRIGIFVWDYIKSTFDEIYFMDDSDVYKIFIYEGVPHVLTADMVVGKLRRFNGITFEEIPQVTTFNPLSVELGGIEQRYGMLMWVSSGQGEVYTYGSLGDRKKKPFNQISAPISAKSIIRKPFENDVYFIGIGTQIKKFNFLTAGGADVSVLYRSPMIKLPTHSVVKEFRIYYPNLGNGSSSNTLRLLAHFNGSTSDTEIGTIGADEISKGFKRLPFVKNDVYSISLVYDYDGASDISNSMALVLPYKIEVIYDETAKK